MSENSLPQEVKKNQKNDRWKSRFTFYLVATSSAVGLGNLWRFPYVVADNGGGAFVFLYIILLFVIGLPLLIAELMLGKSSRKSIIRALRELPFDKMEYKKSVSWLGRLCMMLSLVVLAYFSVVCGWVLHFLIRFLIAGVTGELMDPAVALNALRGNGLLQLLLASAHLVVVSVIVAKDIEEGIEKWVGFIMPVFAFLLIVLVFQSLSLDTTPEALRFFFYPDFSKLDVFSLGNALGHVLFTLSLGFGTMVTFGSYMQEKTHIPTTSFRVVTLDSFISLVAGLLIFPLVFAAGVSQARGPEMLFQTVPFLLSRIPNGAWLGLLFFLCLYLASLGAAIGLVETIVMNLKETYRIKRSRATWWVAGACLSLSIFPALSSTTFGQFQYAGKGVLELVDLILINWVLPLVVLIMALVMGHRFSQSTMREQFLREALVDESLYRKWFVVLKWVIPMMIIVILGAQWWVLLRS